MRVRRSGITVALGIALLAAACGGEDLPSRAVLTAGPQVATTQTTATPGTTASPQPRPTDPTAAPESTSTLPPLNTLAVPPQLTGLPLAKVSVDHEVLAVAIADNSGSRRQGLMNVEDLLDLDGMLFVWTDDTGGGFWMRDTLLPLDIAFFAADGTLVDTFPMEPCDLGSACPSYSPAGRYRYALETEQGRLPAVTRDSVLALPEGFAGHE